MTTRTTWVLVAAAGLAAAPARAEAPPPERLLGASTQVYLRWDGVDAHRRRYEQATVGKLLGQELTPLVQSLLDQFPALLQSEVINRKLLDGAPPARLARIGSDEPPPWPEDAADEPSDEFPERARLL